jgi:hypothetical protein
VSRFYFATKPIAYGIKIVEHVLVFITSKEKPIGTKGTGYKR